MAVVQLARQNILVYFLIEDSTAGAVQGGGIGTPVGLPAGYRLRGRRRTPRYRCRAPRGRRGRRGRCKADWGIGWSRGRGLWLGRLQGR